MSDVIIGFGNQTIKDYGGVTQLKCPRCSNIVFYHLIHTRTWLTYWFIRILPYRSEYHLACPICIHRVEIFGEEIEAAKQGLLKIHINS